MTAAMCMSYAYKVSQQPNCFNLVFVTVPAACLRKGTAVRSVGVVTYPILHPWGSPEAAAALSLSRPHAVCRSLADESCLALVLHGIEQTSCMYTHAPAHINSDDAIGWCVRFHACAASELERRYREGQAVYEEDMLHRLPGDAASLAACEQSFPLAQELLSQEVKQHLSLSEILWCDCDAVQLML